MKTLAAILVFFMSVINTSQATTLTYVYCGLPDGSNWDWLLDNNGNYETIEGTWARITQSNGRYFNVFRVTESHYHSKAFSCPAGYVPQPAERRTSGWEVFEIQKTDGTKILLDGRKTTYDSRGIPSAYRL